MATPIRALRIPDEEWQAAQEVAKRRGETITEAVRRFLRGYIRRNS